MTRQLRVPAGRAVALLRAAAATGTWSNHAYGLAIDLNPVENPYVGCGDDAQPEGAARTSTARGTGAGMVTPAVVAGVRVDRLGARGGCAGAVRRKDYDALLASTATDGLTGGGATLRRMVLFPIAVIWLIVILVWVLRNSRRARAPRGRASVRRWRPSPSPAARRGRHSGASRASSGRARRRQRATADASTTTAGTRRRRCR